MKNPVHVDKRAFAALVVIAVVALVMVIKQSGRGQPAQAHPGPAPATNAPQTEATVELLPNQLNSIKIEPVGVFLFPVEREALGSIDFDQDSAVQVFSPYPGKILTALAGLGDEVKKGQALYTIDSPDLVQAESSLIGAGRRLRSDEQGTSARQRPVWDQRSVRTRD